MTKRQVKRGLKRGLFSAPLVWGSTEDLETIYVNQAYITFTAGEFYIVLGEVIVPLILDASNAPEKVTIAPKVKIAVNPDAMREMAKVFQENVNKFFEGRSK